MKTLFYLVIAAVIVYIIWQSRPLPSPSSTPPDGY